MEGQWSDSFKENMDEIYNYIKALTDKEVNFNYNLDANVTPVPLVFTIMGLMMLYRVCAVLLPNNQRSIRQIAENLAEPVALVGEPEAQTLEGIVEDPEAILRQLEAGSG
jgi:hypothetical protein